MKREREDEEEEEEEKGGREIARARGGGREN